MNTDEIDKKLGRLHTAISELQCDIHKDGNTIPTSEMFSINFPHINPEAKDIKIILDKRALCCTTFGMKLQNEFTKKIEEIF